MLIPVSLEMFFKEFLGCNLAVNGRAELANIVGRNERSLRNWQNAWPWWAQEKVKVWLKDQVGFTLDPDIPSGSEIPVEWIGFCTSSLKEDEAFLGKTLSRIQRFANQDLDFIRTSQTRPKAERFDAYRRYLQEVVMPAYCLNPAQALITIEHAHTFDDLKPAFPQLLTECILDHLAHAEVEYSLQFKEPKSSLARCLPQRNGNQLITPSEVFFRTWFYEVLQDRQCVIAKEFTAHYNYGLKEATSQMWRMTHKHDPPSWITVESWARALYKKVKEKQSREESEETYAQLVIDTFGGVRVLNFITQEVLKCLSCDEALKLIDTYPRRYQLHMSCLTSEAGQKPASDVANG